jgi:undecaprenyl-diphosphatase
MANKIDLPPTSLDVLIGRLVAAHINARSIKVARAATWASDEHVLTSALMALWALSRTTANPQFKKAFEHLAATAGLTIVIPDLLKAIFSRQRPDRKLAGRRVRNTPKNGAADASFPSGHAMHAGALASVLARLYPGASLPIWTICGLLAASRVAIFAHWPSDVLSGFAGGVAIESLLQSSEPKDRRPRHVTGKASKNRAG